jgi:hypothetical protein
MLLEFMCQPGTEAAPDVEKVRLVAEQFRASMDNDTVRGGIAAIPPIGGSSHEVDLVVHPHAEALGFTSQRRELFDEYPVGLRPDWFREVGETGILLEVERGKTVTNNMDLLDLWKCHICTHAEHLFLIVPVRVQRQASAERVFSRVVTRLRTFFHPGNETNVRSLAVFGYGEAHAGPL